MVPSIDRARTQDFQICIEWFLSTDDQIWGFFIPRESPKSLSNFRLYHILQNWNTKRTEGIKEMQRFCQIPLYRLPQLTVTPVSVNLQDFVKWDKTKMSVWWTCPYENFLSTHILIDFSFIYPKKSCTHREKLWWRSSFFQNIHPFSYAKCWGEIFRDNRIYNHHFFTLPKKLSALILWNWIKRLYL